VRGGAAHAVITSLRRSVSSGPNTSDGDDRPVSVERLSEAAVTRWRSAPFTYDAVGSTAGEPPSGFPYLCRTRTLKLGTDFMMAAHALMTWQVQARAGLKLAASSFEVAPDAVVLLRIGVRPFSVSAPCRVAYIVDDADRQGFAYGTLPGHPESGEESFVVERRPDGRVDFTISAFSRAATTMARMGGPITSWVQRRITLRYLHSLDS
jgi:uncharacterized protein (UPF0548 family)